MEAPKRHLFLSQFQYPVAERNWVPVDLVNKTENLSSQAWITGRLVMNASLTPSMLTLCWGGKNLFFDFASDAKESRTSFTWTEILKENDIIGLKIEDLQTNTLKVEQALKIPVQEFVVIAPSGQAINKSPLTHETANLWMAFLQQVRDFFHQRHFTEIHTPTLVPSPGMEPFLDVFETQFESGSYKKTFYLPTSPEFHLKKAVAQGWSSIFEIKPCFRNGEISKTHQPEFWMLEWYRAFANLDSIKTDVKNLVEFLDRNLKNEIAAYTYRNSLKENKPTQGELANSPIVFISQSVSELFQNLLSFKLSPQTTREELAQLATQLNIYFLPSDSWDELFHRIFIDHVEPKIPKENPFFLTDYPASQAALARVNSLGWAERFEVYWKGLELANAYHELNDPKEQRTRFLADQEAKRALNKKVVPIDEDFLRALEFGFPPSGGIALGLDRLFMALFDIPEIKNTRMFPQNID